MKALISRLIAAEKLVYVEAGGLKACNTVPPKVPTAKL